MGLLAVLAGSVTCPFMSYHAADANPFHHYLLVPDTLADHVNSGENSPGGNDQAADSFHDYSLAWYAGILMFSAGAAMAPVDPTIEPPSIFLWNSEPPTLYTQACISLPEKPPPFLSV